MSEGSGGDKAILDQYVTDGPSNQAAVDIFKGEWSSVLPAECGVSAGTVPLFSDGRITTAISRLGGLGGFRVLELGPLEGGHTWMMLEAGASSVTAVESNSRAYLKCLIAKEMLGMTNAHFLLGDCTRFLEESGDRWDLLLASGILYHMRDPVALLRLIAEHSDRAVIWTHYYDAQVLQANGAGQPFKGTVVFDVDGVEAIGRRREYEEQSLSSQAFCGGSASWSVWLTKDSILRVLRHYGYTTITVEYDDHAHHLGPNLLLVAER